MVGLFHAFLFFIVFASYTKEAKAFGCRHYDNLIYNGDTVKIIFSPFFSHPKKLELFKSIEENYTTDNSCFLSEWEIIDNRLYLIKINELQGFHGSQKIGSINLDLVFKDKVKDGRVFAYWVTDSLLSPSGELLHYLELSRQGIYSQETDYFITNGLFTHTKVYDNSASYWFPIHKMQDKLFDALDSKFDLSLLPDTDTLIRVFVHFSGNEFGKVDSVRILREGTEIINAELIRVISTIDGIGINKIRGKNQRIYISIMLQFETLNGIKRFKRPK